MVLLLPYSRNITKVTQNIQRDLWIFCIGDDEHSKDWNMTRCRLVNAAAISEDRNILHHIQVHRNSHAILRSRLLQSWWTRTLQVYYPDRIIYRLRFYLGYVWYGISELLCAKYGNVPSNMSWLPYFLLFYTHDSFVLDVCSVNTLLLVFTFL